MNASLTPKQIQILEWIEGYLAQNHTMPSRREIAEGLGLSSPATIQQHIEALEKKGFLKRGETRESRALQWTNRSKKFLTAIHASKSDILQNDTMVSSPKYRNLERGLERGLEVVGPPNPKSIPEIPLLGSIAAGYPIEVYPQAKSVAMPLDLFVSPKQAAQIEDFYMLSVRGDSMIDEGIFQNDWVLLRRCDQGRGNTQAKNGDTVAALVNGEATLKKFVKGKKGIELHPANPNYNIIEIKSTDRFEIQGILVGVVRRY